MKRAASNAWTHNPPGAEPIVGREAIQQVYERLLGGCQRLAAAPVETFISGNGAAMFYRGELTAKTGAGTACEGINVYVVDASGHIQEVSY